MHRRRPGWPLLVLTGGKTRRQLRKMQCHRANGLSVSLPIQAATGRDVHGRGRPRVSDHRKGSPMSIGLIVLIVLILLLLGILPTWGHSRSWGYGPSGGLGLVVV